MKITNDIRRKIIQVAAFGFSNSHVGNLATGTIYKGSWKNFCNPGLNCHSCPAAGFACPIGAMQNVSSSPKFGFSFYAIGFVLAVGVIFGRAICGYICPFGFLQELIHKIPSPKKRIQKPLTYFKYVLLVVFVLLLPALVTDQYAIGEPAFCEYICPPGTFTAGIPLLLTHPELRVQIGGLFVLKAAILLATIVGCIICCRFFCKTMCPLGAIYGVLNKISLYRMHVVPTQCISCGKCQDICPMDIDPTSHPNSAECIRCGKCVATCPKQAICIGFMKERSSQNAENIDCL